MKQISECYLVITNTDLTEGRGQQVILAHCETRATANRLAMGKGPMGTDAEVKPAPVFIDQFPGIYSRVFLTAPSRADTKEQARLDAIEDRDRAISAALDRAKQWLSEEDIALLTPKP